MFNIKIFNFFTYLLVGIFVLTIMVSVGADIYYENQLELQFDEVFAQTQAFNEMHANYTEPQTIPSAEVVKDYSSEELLLIAQKNLENASSYYSETVGNLSLKLAGKPFAIDIWIKNVVYLNGDVIQEIIAKEVGTFFGGKKGGVSLFFDNATQTLYKNNTWKVNRVDGEWVAEYSSENWRMQTLEDYSQQFGATPGTPIYSIEPNYIIEENYFNTYKDSYTNQITEYAVGHRLNATLSTPLYLSFISFVVGIVEPGLVKTLYFKSLNTVALIDNNINFKSIRYEEKYEFTIDTGLPLLGVVTADCNSTMSYFYVNFNQEISYPKPNIPALQN